MPPARVNALAALTWLADNSLDTEPSMYEIIAIIAVVVAVAIAIVLILAATKPDTFSVQRATTMKAPPENIFSLINDFHRWGTWSPWENKDPAMKRTFSGAA